MIKRLGAEFVDARETLRMRLRVDGDDPHFRAILAEAFLLARRQPFSVTDILRGMDVMTGPSASADVDGLPERGVGR